VLFVSDDPWLALGLDLRLLATEEGGRSKPITTGNLQYRPNWGLPGMAGTDQVGAPVLRFGREPLAPGETTRAVVIPRAPQSMHLWLEVKVGDELRMFEGPRVCGTGLVKWIADTERPMPEDDNDRFTAWAEGDGDRP
jgi:hypothetical protein